MQYAGEAWVERLRAGVVPRARGVAIAVIVLVVAGVGLTVLEWSHPRFLAEATTGRGGFAFVIGPPGMVVGGIALAIASWWRQRSDRVMIARIRGGADGTSGAPVLFVPVVAKGQFLSEDLPAPRPTIWTVDAAGLHAWTPSEAKPVLDLPWETITGFELATNDRAPVYGQRIDYGVRVLGAKRPIVLVPRADLGRPLGAGAYRLDVLKSLLRSFQAQLGA